MLESNVGQQPKCQIINGGASYLSRKNDGLLKIMCTNIFDPGEYPSLIKEYFIRSDQGRLYQSNQVTIGQFYKSKLDKYGLAIKCLELLV